MQLSAARVFVRSLERAKQFYAELLGLPVKADGLPYGYCVFDVGSSDLVVELVKPEDPGEEQALVSRFTGLSFAVPDIVAAHERLSSAGVHFAGLPEKQFWGGWLATFEDFDGNQLQLVQHGV